jgi:MFS transporter, DHA2 family, multidrug resistance protein
MSMGISSLSWAEKGRDFEDDTMGVLAPRFASLTYNRKLTILLAASLVTSVEISNRLSLNVILPDMQGNVAADFDQISWVLTLYNMGFLCSMVLTPWMTRLFGLRRHFTICAGLYTIGALGCFLSSHNLTLLLISRVVMGFGGGLFLVRLVIMAGMFFPGKSRAVPLTWAYVVLFGMESFYPTTIGAISDHIHWNYAFLLDLPFLLVGTLVLRKLLPPGDIAPKPHRMQGEDYWGAGLIIFGLVALQVFESRGERDLWFESPLISTSFALFVVSFALFAWWDSRAENPSPVLHLRHVFQLASLRRAMVATIVVGAIFGAGLFVIPQYLRTVQDYSATQTGEFFSLYILGFGTGCITTLRILVPRLGPRLCCILGMSLLAATFTAFVYSWTPSTPGYLLETMLFVQGWSLGLSLIGVAGAATGQFAAADVWEGDTTYFFVRQLANTTGLAAVTILFDRRMTLHSSRLLDVANRLDPTTNATLSSYARLVARSAGAGSDPRLGALQLFQNNVVTQSRLLSYIDVSFFLALVCVVGAIGSIRLMSAPAKRHPRMSSIHI